jgi:hypothetical protein
MDPLSQVCGCTRLRRDVGPSAEPGAPVPPLPHHRLTLVDPSDPAHTLSSWRARCVRGSRARPTRNVCSQGMCGQSSGTVRHADALMIPEPRPVSHTGNLPLAHSGDGESKQICTSRRMHEGSGTKSATKPTRGWRAAVGGAALRVRQQNCDGDRLPRWDTSVLTMQLQCDRVAPPERAI